jgi:hypothetical protein
MDFSDKELRVLLQALYRYRGEVSGASQSEQNKFTLVASVIGKIETKVGPLTAERTGFDREMDESLSVLTTGRMGVAKTAKATGELDKAANAPKVNRSVAAEAPKGKAPKAAKGKVADKAKPAAGLKGKKVDSSKKR